MVNLSIRAQNTEVAVFYQKDIACYWFKWLPSIWSGNTIRWCLWQVKWIKSIDCVIGSFHVSSKVSKNKLLKAADGIAAISIRFHYLSIIICVGNLDLRLRFRYQLDCLLIVSVKLLNGIILLFLLAWLVWIACNMNNFNRLAYYWLLYWWDRWLGWLLNSLLSWFLSIWLCTWRLLDDDSWGSVTFIIVNDLSVRNSANDITIAKWINTSSRSHINVEIVNIEWGIIIACWVIFWSIIVNGSFLCLGSCNYKRYHIRNIWIHWIDWNAWNWVNLSFILRDTLRIQK